MTAHTRLYRFILMMLVFMISPNISRGFQLISRRHSVRLRDGSVCGNQRTRRFLSDKADDFFKNLEVMLDSQESSQNKGQTSDWRIIDWEEGLLTQQQHPRSPSPVQQVLVRNRLVHFKRDDELKPSVGAPISGNKARKMMALNDMTAEDFPSCVVSYGGPQSNSMLALSAIVHFKNQVALEKRGLTGEKDPEPIKRFVYYTKKLPRFLRNQPSGNFFRAQTLGMELVELSAQEYGNLFGSEWGGPTEAPPAIDPPVPGDSLWVRTFCYNQV